MDSPISINLATASWGELIVATAIVVVLIFGAWWLTILWERERKLVESFEPRTDDTWFVRWQRSSVGHARVSIFVGRVILAIMAIGYAFVIVRRILK